MIGVEEQRERLKKALRTENGRHTISGSPDLVIGDDTMAALLEAKNVALAECLSLQRTAQYQAQKGVGIAWRAMVEALVRSRLPGASTVSFDGQTLTVTLDDDHEAVLAKLMIEI